MNKAGKISRNIVLMVIGLLWFVPLLFMFGKSFEDGGFANYATILQQENLPRNFLNSVVVTGGTIAVVLVVTLLAGFAFSKLKFRGKNVLYLIVLVGLMIPAPALIVPLSQLVKTMGLINNPLSLIGIYAALQVPFSLLIMKNYFDELPTELIESGIVDGCSVFKAFRKILIPLCAPVVSAVTVFTFLAAWNEFLLAFMFLKKPIYQTLTVIPYSFTMLFMSDLPRMFAALTIIALPIIILYICLQKQFEQGLTAGSVKG